MDKMLLLLAGYPGTGKSYLANIILNKYKTFCLISPDKIKEKYWDKYGFKSLDEKEILIQKAWEEYYKILDFFMNKSKNIISEYPFSEKQKDMLFNISKKYNYNNVTIRMVCEINVLFERQKIRDISNDRHLGHILNVYNKNISIENKQNASGILTYEEFYNRCKNRGYDKFQLGKLFQLDVTNYNVIDYDLFLKNIIKV